MDLMMLLVSQLHHLQWLHHLQKSKSSLRNGIGRIHHLVKMKTGLTLTMAANHSTTTYRRYGYNHTSNICAYGQAITRCTALAYLGLVLLDNVLKVPYLFKRLGSIPRCLLLIEVSQFCEEKLDTRSLMTISGPLAKYGRPFFCCCLIEKSITPWQNAQGGADDSEV